MIAFPVDVDREIGHGPKFVDEGPPLAGGLAVGYYPEDVSRFGLDFCHRYVGLSFCLVELFPIRSIGQNRPFGSSF